MWGLNFSKKEMKQNKTKNPPTNKKQFIFQMLGICQLVHIPILKWAVSTIWLDKKQFFFSDDKHVSI